MGGPSSSPHASQSTKLQNRLKLEKCDLSYADLHSEVMKNVDTLPPTSSGLHQKQRMGGNVWENKEVVKYMSKVPLYLERGENLQDKALSVGVLDWRRLEKWQYNHKPIPYRSGRYSPPSSNTSSFFSTDGSSNPSSRGHSCSPARKKMPRSSLQMYLNASPKEGYSQCVTPSVGNVDRFQDLKAVPSSPLKGQQSICRTYQPFNKNPSEIKLKECKRKDSDLQSICKTKTSRGLKNCGVLSSSKGKMPIQAGESIKEAKKIQETVVLLLPRDGPENSQSEISHPFDLTEINGQNSTESSPGAFSERSHFEEVHTELYSNIPHSCPLPYEVDGIRCSLIEQPTVIDAESFEFSSDPCLLSPSPAKILISPYRRKIQEEKKPTIMPRNSTVIKSSKGLDLKMGTVAATKVRNPSPTRRFSIDMGSIGRGFSSKDGAAIPQLSSKHVAAKSGAERVEVSACSDYSTKPSATSRYRSSPLRRLLDPLLKPRAANSRQFAEPSQKDSASAGTACKSSDGRGESSTVHSGKVKLDLRSCRTINIDDSHHNDKHGSSTVQALVRIAIKNGLPLFTFAVDNSSDVLAATMKRLSSSRKDDNSWIYTFFTIREMKKNNASWLIQGGKRKGHGYIPNVVAQMNVIDPSFSNLSRHHSMDQYSIRECVLFAVDLRQLDQQTSDLQPNDELAAIVVKVPRKTTRRSHQDGRQSYNFNNQSAIGLKESLLNDRGYSSSRGNEQNGLSVGSQDSLSTTVILPGGVHGLPSKGEPSSLIERWKSGGFCDCGGWDLGCRTTVLANQTPPSRRSSSTKTYLPTGRFELFSQGEVLDDKPIFSLFPFKEGIFSVEFNSSLSLLQAFSICIAVLESRKPSELSVSENLYEEKFSGATTLLEDDVIPTRYASYPPLSPAGRV